MHNFGCFHENHYLSTTICHLKNHHLRQVFNAFRLFVHYSGRCLMLLLQNSSIYLFWPHNGCYICYVKRQKEQNNLLTIKKIRL